ncbi:beta-N-acetylhexosaminidase [Ruminococcaceae bacterium FB2012]|nr:beta-N-acetylhexosaminidase [Ruminococcaceae bacterium FB2012]
MIKRKIILSAAAALALCSCGHSIPQTEIEVTTPAAVTTAGAPAEDSSSAAETVTTTASAESKAEEESSSQAEVPAKPLTKAEEVLAKLSLREKVGQLFVFRFDSLIYDDNLDHMVQAVDDEFIKCRKKYPVGGFIAMGANIASADQVKKFNSDVNELYGSVKPFICIDEEGGSVARVANSGVIDVPQFPSMSTIAAGGDVNKAYELGSTVGGYLKELGYNLDLAPVADVNTNPLNIVIGNRAFGSDPEAASGYVSAMVDGLHEQGIMSCLKHFPGHGDTAEDTHFLTAAVNKTWEEMKECELIPFIGSLDKTDMVMAAHIIAPKVTGDDTPASLSYTLMTEKLRNELGFEGVIITDSLGMGAVNRYYTSEECCIAAIQAGVDLLLKPAKDYEAFEGVVKAVKDGTISEERLNESVLRILNLKEKYGLLV